MGRKRKDGPRSKSGRLLKLRDYGNNVVQARRALFDAQCIRQGKAADQVFDGIGQLWAMDFLDNDAFDPELLRDTARQYGECYWRRNADKAPKTAKLERGDRSRQNYEDTRKDLLFERWCDDLPAWERSVLEHTVVDYWFSDGNAGFVSRLVSTELLKRGRMPDWKMVELSTAADHDLLQALMRALFILVDGALPARFERRAA